MTFQKGNTMAKERYTRGDHFGFKKDYTPWDKGLTKETDERIRKIAEKLKGRHSSPSTEFKKGHKPHNTGKRFIHSGTFKSGPNHPNWKGGLTPLLIRLRKTEKYKRWRKAVWERDNYTCQECGKRGGKLDAHHIKSFAECPELRFVINNGITLCKDCHNLTKRGRAS